MPGAPQKNYYEVLGVNKSASKSDIRSAYRRCAREAHPDFKHDESNGSARDSSINSSTRMTEISQAWAVLSDPERRREYDAMSDIESEFDFFEPQVETEFPIIYERAKIPWRIMLVLLFVGIALVLVLDAMSKPSVSGGPDGLLDSGSCIVIDANLTAVEVPCEGAHDGVVRQLVGFDMSCPSDTEAIRDRQGMGLACVVRN